MIEQNNNPKTLREYLRLYFTGFAMGSADIVPGVSGGTMAFILGIYEDLINAIKSFNLDVLRMALGFKIKEILDAVPYRFLITLGLGILTAILLLSRILTNLLENNPEYLYGFFFGLVGASIIAISAHIEEWRPQLIGSLLLGAAIAVFIVTRPQVETQGNVIVLFFSGMIAITAMILPGISGSFMLLILGQYHTVLDSISNFEIVNLMAVAAGCAVGLVLFVRILSWLLDNYHQPMISLLIGFMLGSMLKIWPWKSAFDTEEQVYQPQEVNIWPDLGSSDFWVVVLLMTLGFIIVNILDHMQSKSNPVVMVVRRLVVGRAAS